MSKLYVKIRSFWCMIYFFNSVDQMLTKCWPICKWVIWMFHFSRVSWKLQTAIAIAFWLMKCLLKLLTFIVKNAQRIWSTWNWTLHKFLSENMQAVISNMEDIHELIIWNDTYAFRVHMTTVLIERTPLFGCLQRPEFHAFWQKMCKNVTRSYLQFR